MKVNVKILGKQRKVELKGETDISGLLKKMKVNPETVIVKRRDEILLEDEKIRNNDKIELIKIVSGG